MGCPAKGIELMKQANYWLALAVVTSLSVVACKREETVPPPASASPPVASVAPAVVAAAAPAATALPVKEDFEESAREAINEENVDEQVKGLEAEIPAK